MSLRMGLRLAGLALVALIIAYALWQRGEAISARAEALRLQGELAVAAAARAQAEEAARVHRIYLGRLQAESETWASIEADLRRMEGRDAPLSPLLRATASRLWGSSR